MVQGFIVAFQGLCSQTRDSTHIPCIGRQSLSPWTTGEVPLSLSLKGDPEPGCIPKFDFARPITSWQIDGEKVKTVTDFIWEGGSKITADGDCSYEIKRCLLLGRKVMTNLDSLLKSRDITLPIKSI